MQALPATGAYTLLVDPSSTLTGGFTLQAGEAGGLSLFGPPVTVVVTAQQPTGPLTFSASAGQGFSIFTSDNTIADGTITVNGPDGTPLTSSGLSGVFNFTAPAAGTYSVTVTPANGATGRITLYLIPGGGGSGPID